MLKRHARMYSLFCKVADRKYERLSCYAYPKAQAVRIYQSALLTGSMYGQVMALRPVAGILESGTPEASQATANYDAWVLRIRGL